MSNADFNPSYVIDVQPVLTIYCLDILALPQVPAPPKKYGSCGEYGGSGILDLELIEQGVPVGQQNAQLHAYAWHLRSRGYSWESAEELMREAADNCEGGYEKQDTNQGQGWLSLLERAWASREDTVWEQHGNYSQPLESADWFNESIGRQLVAETQAQALLNPKCPTGIRLNIKLQAPTGVKFNVKLEAPHA